MEKKATAHGERCGLNEQVSQYFFFSGPGGAGKGQYDWRELRSLRGTGQEAAFALSPPSYQRQNRSHQLIVEESFMVKC